jgi:hypothetical protein
VFTIDRPSERSSLDEPGVEPPGPKREGGATPPEKVALPAVLAAAAFASLGAGAIHAAAAGAHAETRAASVTFVALAVLQIGWGVLALHRPHRLVTLAGALVNAGAVAGWVLAKASGIGFVNGLDEKEPAQFADTLAAGLAAVAVVGALLSLASRLSWARRPNAFVVGVAAVAALGLASPAMVQTGNHQHPGGASHDMAGGHAAGAHDMSEMNSVQPPKKYDGTLPVDFSGVPGVTPEQQAWAEDLATRTIQDLPQWADPATAEAAGYQTIGDGPTGTEHYMKWDAIDDDVQFDPNHPESLVYDVAPDGTRTLAAAMYMLPPSVSLDEVPDDGGALIQYHVHDNLCFTQDDPTGPKVRGITNAEGQCPPGLIKFQQQAPMMHVWIREHPCGPFAALEGIGGGQIAEGETVNCDHVHGEGGT